MLISDESLPPGGQMLRQAFEALVATLNERGVRYAIIGGMASWNQRHLANIRRRDLFNSVNRVAGYRKMLEIANPLEVLYE